MRNEKIRMVCGETLYQTEMLFTGIATHKKLRLYEGFGYTGVNIEEYYLYGKNDWLIHTIIHAIIHTIHCSLKLRIFQLFVLRTTVLL
jgi:hypothetical protein